MSTSTSTDDALSVYDDDVIEQLINRIDELEATVDEQADTIDDLEEQLSEHQQHSGKERAELNQRVSDVEADSDGGEGETSPSDGKGVDDDSTPLERICALPEHVVSDNLTANQQRARSVARRIDEYGKSVPAGIAITSSRIKRVLTAQEDSTIHRQTVKRVANFLEKFGDGSVKIKETRGGKTTVVFDEKLVDDVTAVVTDNTDSGVTATTI